MEYRTIGDSEQPVSRIAFGCWAIGGHGYGIVDDELSGEAVQTALEYGINLFDTADIYGFGYSETLLGKALGSKRHEVIIATKGGVRWDEQKRITKDCSPSYLTEALEQSLRRLQLDCIPLYQIHYYDGCTPIGSLVECLEQFRQEGKIRFWGISNITSDFLEEVLHLFNPVSLATLQLPFGLNQKYSQVVLQKAHEQFNLTTLIYSVLGRGIFSGNYTEDSSFGENDTRNRDPDFTEKIDLNLRLVHLLRKISEKYKKTPSQVAIRWALDHYFIDTALIGMKTADQVKENVKAVNWQLAAEDNDQLSLLSDQLFGK